MKNYLIKFEFWNEQYLFQTADLVTQYACATGGGPPPSSTKKPPPGPPHTSKGGVRLSVGTILIIW